MEWHDLDDGSVEELLTGYEKAETKFGIKEHKAWKQHKVQAWTQLG